jgi:hypothetical protein
MDWLHILEEIFDVCLIPLLGIATAALIAFVREKMAEGRDTVKTDLAAKYLYMLEATVIDCIKATNQTYVNALKDQNAFDAEAQKLALSLTKDAVLKILSADAKNYLNNFVGDLDVLIQEKIEANIESSK